MKYVFCLTILAGLLTGLIEARANGNYEVDSVGSERVGGKIFVLHRVNQGQTMFAVVRQYGTSIQALRDANPGMNDQIQSGQTIRVPYTPKTSRKDSKKEDKKEAAKVEEKEVKPAATTPAVTVPAPTAPAATTPAATTTPATTSTAPAPVTTSAPTASATTPTPANGLHKVEPGETLYRVAVKYGVLMADLRKWNNLTDDNLKDGLELIVSEKGIEKPAPAVTAPAPKVTTTTTVVKDSVKAKAIVPEKVVKPVEEVAPPKVVKGKKKSESGLAEVIETDESTSKFLGLHRTAPVGALVEVLNEYNQEKIIVRIIGRIPDTSINDDIVIKLSSRAFEKVSPNSKRFRAVVSYLE
ncbi:LysM peptidoglycan-binding domain-containing protein [Dyadobacter chenwenxiniae]|uniref:LysM peptidoglycan-binding domain-containing protein n=1 Tax=Dyadobacter chenwenxiniae TaxID=2906456 RepID=A0A9X1PGM1_9BACT|nr:LysM peptidoglycan-binding domain-containing protein [Dyadobacter chenwenxiniae]MCF0053427.1 LysM peptidoglycan-binding domain-containing protein [Dyadobacter chenwenxiniae]MCF0060842.1 LysM peptidoglycan-binding domain-containing protein [Dyadobacter chenwenxiniae]UON80671.1 LysM peptidoglycan-binding domain-containing protein [Dyadobacter chenwenxiniae]